MKPEIALLRLVADEKAPIMPRVRALEAIDHPPLILLHGLIVEPKTHRTKPVPSKLRAVATLKYAQEMGLRRMRKAQKARSGANNALGI